MRLPSGLSTYDYSRRADSKGWGAGWPTCFVRNTGQIVTVVTARSQTHFPVHRRISRLLELLLNEVERRGYIVGPYGSWGGECRQIAGTDSPSNHSWWLAIDIRAPWNPYTSSGTHDIPDWVYALFRAYGFGVGADYTGAKKDWMHFEFMGSPEDADLMTALAERNFGRVGEATNPPAPAPAYNGPAFPLPAGYYYGPKSGPTESFSGSFGNHPAWVEGLKSAQRRIMQILPGSLPKYGADGKYGDVGSETYNAVKQVQKGKGLNQDGLLGPKTWNALFQ